MEEGNYKMAHIERQNNSGKIPISMGAVFGRYRE